MESFLLSGEGAAKGFRLFRPSLLFSFEHFDSRSPGSSDVCHVFSDQIRT